MPPRREGSDACALPPHPGEGKFLRGDVVLSPARGMAAWAPEPWLPRAVGAGAGENPRPSAAPITRCPSAPSVARGEGERSTAAR